MTINHLVAFTCETLLQIMQNTTSIILPRKLPGSQEPNQWFIQCLVDCHSFGGDKIFL